MANYTIELGTLLDEIGYDWGMKDYPVPDYASENAQEFRDYLNNLIKNHYYFNEICDVPDRFKVFINNCMNVNMPYYCKLLQAFHDNSSIVKDANFVEKYIGEGENSAESSGSNSGNSYNLTVSSTTPAAMLNVEDDIQNNTYASSAQKNKGNNSSTNSSNSKGSNKQNYVREVTGTQGKTRAEQYKIYVESLQNVYAEIIEKLSTCFMEVY